MVAVHQPTRAMVITMLGTETLDSGDPEDLSDDVRDEEESDQVAELVVDQADILLKAEDTGVSHVGPVKNLLESNLMVLNGLSDRPVEIVQENKNESLWQNPFVELAKNGLLFLWVNVDGFCKVAWSWCVAQGGHVV